ncbi:hypothetical protein MNAN1_003412 [Malassezia nana]|uniref:SET domain-containing protein n=1 Tax=Malassezia nana TaxID=180528 RepID=A0AAF0J3V2_9BASI|nr:hypothetical protein MNAN1_003412 [Malassezia nana]
MGSFARADPSPRPEPPPPAVPTASVTAQEDDENDQGTDDETGIIRCICLCDDDDGFTIQCDKCLVWQHCACFGMSHSSVPDEYLCEQCDPRPVDIEYARAHQRHRLQEEARKAQKARDVSAAVALHESAAKAAWNAAIQGTSLQTTQRRRSQGQRSPPKRAVPDSDLPEPPEISTPGHARSKSRSVKKPRGGVNGRKSHGSVFRSKHEDDEDSDLWQAWHMEFTDIETNHVRDPKTVERLAEYVLAWKHTPRLETMVDEHGFHIAPLRFAQDVHGDIRPPPKGDAHFARHGLAPVGQDCVPVHMSCESLDAVSARVHVRSISDQVVNNFFNNIHHLQAVSSEPQKIWSASKMFCRPSMHGLFSEAPIPAGAFIVQYRGELYSADAYRADPINQYAKMGTSKPHVRLLPPPLNLAVDARMYGNAARFARASCHPNAVLRPILQKDGDSWPKLHFGLFALAPIPKSHEITVGWDWDDHHIVHVLPALVRRPWAIDDTPLFTTPAEAKVQSELDMEAFYQRGEFPYASSILASKFQAVMAVLLSYATCGCLGPSLGGSSTNAFLMRRQNCAVTQMLRVGQGMPLLYTSHILKSLSKPKPITLAPLVGVFRHWTAHVPMDAETHLCSKLAQNIGYVQRVQRTGNEQPVWPPPPMPTAATTSSDMDDSCDEASDAESVGHDSSITEPMSEDEMAFASDPEDPVVAKALRHLDAAWEPAVLPFKKRTDRTRLKAQPMPATDGLRAKRPARPHPPTKMDVPAKRQKVRALYDASEGLLPSSSEDEEYEDVPAGVVSPTRRPKTPEPHPKPKPKPTVARKPTTPPNALLMTAPVRRVSPTTLPTPAPTSTPSPVRAAEVKPEVPLNPAGADTTPLSPPPAVASASSPASASAPAPAPAPAPVTESPPREPTPPPPPPPPPPKRLSLAEYKKRLALRRQSEGKSDAPDESPNADPAPASAPVPSSAETTSSISPVLAPMSNGFAPEPGPVASTQAPYASTLEREAIRSVYIPQSPPHTLPVQPPVMPPALVPNPVSAAKDVAVSPTWHRQEAKSTRAACTDPGTQVPYLPPVVPSSSASALPVPAPVSSALSVRESRPTVQASSEVPVSAPLEPPVRPAPPVPGALVRPPPPGPPPGPPPPMPARLRAAHQRAEERRLPVRPPGPPPVPYAARSGSATPVRGAPPSRAGFGRGGWRPL